MVGTFPEDVSVPMTTVVRKELILAGVYDARAENFEEAIALI